MMNYVVSFDAVASISSGSSSAVWTLLLFFLNAALVFISISPSIPPLLAHNFLSRQFLFDRDIPVPQNLSNEHSTNLLFPVFNNVSPIEGFCLNFSIIPSWHIFLARLKHKPQLVIFNLISQPYLVSHSKGWRITFGKGGWVCHSTVNV